ncbi:MAG: GNAT family N-acetyltransferase [Muribaculaceae bacterium]
MSEEMVKIVRYDASLKQQWDEFVGTAKNSSFLHRRDYMDYHSHRFADYSLMAYQGDRLVALLPANRDGSVLYSHQGLTFGGWIMPLLHFNVVVMLRVMDAAVEYLKADGIETIEYRAMPHIYHTYPAEEDLYALFRHGAELTVSNVSSSIDLSSPLHFNTGAKSSVAYARKNGISVGESDRFADFWQVLSQLLRERYDAAPVHSLDEILLLKSRFPGEIRLYTAEKDGELLGGVVTYRMGSVMHSQYTAATQSGWQYRVIPAIYNHILHNECNGCRYFDLGTSNEDRGRYLNEGLVLQKCGMGGRAIVYNTYKITLR